MTLAFLLIGGCIVGLILLCYYTNAISGSNFSPAHLRELRKADEEEKQSNEETSSFQEQSIPGSDNITRSDLITHWA